MSHHYHHYNRPRPSYRTNMPEDYQEMSKPAEEAQAPEEAQNPEPDQPVQEQSAREEAAPAVMAEELENLKKELQDERLRMAAEMDNFKKRLNREHQEQMRYASEKVLADLLPALDNLDLAIQYGSDHEACASMMQGIEMTRKLLLDAVAKNGLATLGETGESFDPALHEAIGMEQNPEMEKGAVSRVMQRGYKLNDRVLRPAKVMVNN